MTKVKHCKRCDQTRPIEMFGLRSKKSAGARRRSQCDICKREIDQKYYLKHKGQARARSHISKKEMGERNRRYLFEFLLLHPCVVCGESNPVMLEFDHLRDKKFNISEASRVSTPRLIEEVAKCQVLCANHHRIKTAEEQKWVLLEMYREYQLKKSIKHGETVGEFTVDAYFKQQGLTHS